VVVVCERDDDERVVVVCERLVLDCCPLGVSDAVFLVLVVLDGFDDDEVDDEVDGDEAGGGKGDSDEVDREVELGWLGVVGSSLSPPLELDDDDEVDADEGDSEERDDDDVELGCFCGFGSSLSPPLELDGDGVFALEPGEAGELAGWPALVDACRSMGGLGLCAAGALACWAAAATLVAVCGVKGVLAGCTGVANAAVRGDSAGANEEVAVRACGTGAGLVGVGVSEVGKVGVGIAFGRQVSTAGLPDEGDIVALGLGGEGIKGLGAGEL